MSKASDLLRAVALYRIVNGEPDTHDVDTALRAISDAQLQDVVLIAAGLLSILKKEAQRRGTWDEIKGSKV